MTTRKLKNLSIFLASRKKKEKKKKKKKAYIFFFFKQKSNQFGISCETWQHQVNKLEMYQE